MGLFENFPYANFHELNLDWILHELKELETQITNFVAINSVKYANPIVWDITSQYETNTVVLDSSGNAYLSVQPVPAGVALDREEYWTKIGNFSALWDSVRSAITPYDEQHSTTASIDHKPGDWVWLENDLLLITKNINAGDKYVDGSNCKKTNLHDLFTTLGDTITGEVNNISSELQNEITARAEADAVLEQKIAENSTELKNSLFFLNPTSFGAVGDGVTDDSDAINAAISRAIADGKQVAFDKKTYYCAKTINVPGNTVIDMNGSTILSSAENGVVIGVRTTDTKKTSLTAAFTAGSDPVFTAEDASIFNVGDVVNVEDIAHLYEPSRSYYASGCTAIVISKSGNTITLSNAPTTAIAVGSTVYNYGNTKAILRNGTITGRDVNNGSRGILVTGCNTSTLTNMKVENFQTCFAFYYCDSCLAQFCISGHSKNNGDTWSGYGMMFASCNNCGADHCISKSGQHGISHGGWTPTSNSFISNCEINNETTDSYSLDCHENVVNGSVKNCIIYKGAATAGDFIIENCTFIGNTANLAIMASSVKNRAKIVFQNNRCRNFQFYIREQDNMQNVDLVSFVSMIRESEEGAAPIKTSGLNDNALCECLKVDNCDNVAVNAVNTKTIELLNCTWTVNATAIYAKTGENIIARNCKFPSKYAAVNISEFKNVLFSNCGIGAKFTDGSMIFTADNVIFENTEFLNMDRYMQTTGSTLLVVNSKLKATANQIESTTAKFINSQLGNGAVFDGKKIGTLLYKETREADGTVKLVQL